MKYLLLFAILLGGCAATPEKVYWQNLYADTEFYHWVCQVDQAKPVNEWGRPGETYAQQYHGRCFRAMKPRNP